MGFSWIFPYNPPILGSEFMEAPSHIAPPGLERYRRSWWVPQSLSSDTIAAIATDQLNQSVNIYIYIYVHTHTIRYVVL